MLEGVALAPTHYAGARFAGLSLGPQQFRVNTVERP
jgi:hypothetical protein